MKSTFASSWAAAFCRGAFFLGLQCVASLSWAALPGSGIWAGTCQTAGCHGGAIRPLAGAGPSADLPTALSSRAATGAGSFYQFVRDRPFSAAMSSISDTDAPTVRRYLLERLFGDIESPGLVTSDPPVYSKSMGSVVLGATGTSSLSITNHRTTGSITYSVSSDTPSEFWVSAESCAGGGRSIAVSNTCDMTLNFRPSATGPHSATLTITVAGLAHSISLSGTGTAPTYSVGSTNLAMSATVGAAPNSNSTTITNTGTATLSLSSLAIGGAAAADYAFGGSNTCTPSGVSLGVGSSCTLHITFTPSVAGSRNASVSITHNATGSPSTVTLTGTATPAPAPTISATVPLPGFVDTELGSNRVQTITVTNVGTAPLVFSSLAVSGSHASDFTRGGTCSTAALLAVSAQCTISISFAPSALGARTATLAINSNASNGNLSVPLSGTGVPVPAPLVTLSDTALPFGNQSVGGVYAPRQVTLTNTGTAALAISSLSVGAGAFSLVDASPCGSSLAAGASCNIRVQFTPTVAATDYTGNVTLASNAAGSPHPVALTGRGTAAAAPVLVWSPLVSTLDFGTVAVGSPSASRTVTVSNQGPGAATITLVNAVGADAAQFTVTPLTCAVGELLYEGSSCNLSVVYAPGFPGARSAQLQFASTGSPPTALSLTGVGSGGPTPMAALSDTTLALGTVHVGARSAPVEVTLTSSGSGPLQVTATTINGPYTVSSKTCPALPFELPSGSRCVLTVSYQPTAKGVQAGALTVTTNAANGPHTVALSGQGEAAVDVSSGGCSLAQGDSLLDPTLWLLALAAVAVLWRRRVQALARAR